jgi:NADPH:quinone reductase-like Zn-dependent oxidoreductase
MKSAIVESYSRAPRYGEFADPVAQAGQQLVTVHAAALAPLTKSITAGRHYCSGNSFPFVPGVDGVGWLEDGQRVYFAFPAAPYGSMAERTVVNRSLCVALPDELDDLTAAVAANPGMSSWAALTERAGFVAGETVLINGATGVAGRLAIQISKYLGAKTVIVTGRNQASVTPLAELGADLASPLDQEPEKLAESFRRTIKEHGVNVILDYLWGASAQSLIGAITGHGSVDGEPPVRFVQIGSITGKGHPAASSRAAQFRTEIDGQRFGQRLVCRTDPLDQRTDERHCAGRIPN